MTARLWRWLAGASALAVLAVIASGNSAHRSQDAAVAAALPSLQKVNQAAAALRRITVTELLGTYSLVHEDGPAKDADLDVAAQGWTLELRGHFPVPPAIMRPVLTALRQARVAAPRTGLGDLLPRLQLDDPEKGGAGHVVELEGEGEEKATLVIGRQRNDALAGAEGGFYLRWPGQEQAWLATPSLSFPAHLADWVDHRIIDLDPDKMSRMSCQFAGGPLFDVYRPGPGKYMVPMVNPPDRMLFTNDPAGIVAATFKAMDFIDVLPIAEVATEMVQGVTRITMEDGLVVTFALFKHDDHPWFTVHAEGTGSEAVNARTTGWAYRMTDGKSIHLGFTDKDFFRPQKTPQPAP